MSDATAVQTNGIVWGTVSPAAFVPGYLALGERDEAFVWLEKAFSERSNYMAFLAVNPFHDGVRTDPRFQDLLRRVGLE